MQDLKRISDFLKGTHWRKRGAWYSTVLLGEITQPGEYMQGLFGFPYTRQAGFLSPEGYFDWQEEWDANCKLAESEYSKDPDYLDKYAKLCEDEGIKLLSDAKRFRKLLPRKLTVVELAEAHAAMVRRIQEYMPFMSNMHYIDNLLTRKFVALTEDLGLRKGLPSEDIFEIRAALSFPPRKMLVIEAKDVFLGMARDAKKGRSTTNTKAFKARIDQYVESYRWLSTISFEAEPLTFDAVLAQVKEAAKRDVSREIQESKKAIAGLLRTQRELMRRFKQETELIKVSKALQVFGFLRSFRVDCTYVAYVNCWHILVELAKALKVSPLDLRYLTSDEIIGAAKGDRGYSSSIQSRKKEHMTFFLDGRLFVLEGEMLKKVKKSIVFPAVERSGELRGMTAYPGIARGAARVVNALHEGKMLMKGEILIISMTDPQYVPIMERAAAFVTDQGGITCHAAIVAREMKKPCIIGTRHATQVFKTGDLIEIDATNGIVRKINKP